ncbi:MAG: hypothetical protein H6Q00_1443 [Holophagaceae bacterium]|nr:hypothetical protein [Holophagaceae bacterium]
MADGDTLMGDPGTDVLDLPPRGHKDALLLAQLPDVPADGARVALQQQRQILLAEQAALLTGLLGEPLDQNLPSGGLTQAMDQL